MLIAIIQQRPKATRTGAGASGGRVVLKSSPNELMPRPVCESEETVARVALHQ